MGVGWVALYILSVARFVYPAPALYATIRKKVSMGEGVRVALFAESTRQFVTQKTIRERSKKGWHDRVRSGSRYMDQMWFV